MQKTAPHFQFEAPDKALKKGRERESNTIRERERRRRRRRRRSGIMPGMYPTPEALAVGKKALKYIGTVQVVA